LAGILPTLTLQDLTMENITDLPRYRELNRTLTELRGYDFVVHIKGLDELTLTSNNMMLEACNTSFQIHYQADPETFPDLYNVAQAITAPLLAAAVNSPILFHKRLWHETRLALFERSVDERSRAHLERERPPRVGFGDGWMRNSVMEMFHEDAARYRVIMTADADEDPAAVLSKGEIPRLSALRVHNGTVWHWNRPCYGVLRGKPHLRIENRVMPAGPSVIDQMANAALFFGLMYEMPHAYPPIDTVMAFDHAKENFYSAARHGLNGQFTWFGGKTVSPSDLLLKELIPLARQGLNRAGIEATDIDRYLGVLEERVQSGITGSQWALRSLAGQKQQNPEASCRFLTEFMLRNQRRGVPVHCWEPAQLEESDSWIDSFRRVGQFMSTDLFTVRPGDLIDLAASIMDWEQLRHIPVEDDAGKLVGLLSHHDMLHLFASGHSATGNPVAVRDIMKYNPVTVTPETPTLEAINKMRECRIGCLPVVRNDRLVGIVTLIDLLKLSSKLLEKALAEETEETHD
ncbi:MAG TPA: CBS domain-containing protein, partial [Acidobacteriota bacterium]|nr:CBS domain-containing protein [Acidobacteriota bacterium]